MDLPDFEGWLDSLNLEPLPLGISFIVAFLMGVMLLDPSMSFLGSMSVVPLLYRIIITLAALPVTYFVIIKMTNR